MLIILLTSWCLIATVTAETPGSHCASAENTKYIFLINISEFLE